MNILLINIKSNRRSSFQKYVPLALLKLSTFYKEKGYNVEYIEAGKRPKTQPDIICFSTIFLFNIKKDIGYIKAYQQQYPSAKIRVGGIAASLRHELFKDKLGDTAEIHVGLCEEIENQKPDYEIANVDFSYGFTSRGCYKKCKWCVVPIIEGNIYANSEWLNCLGDNHKHFSAMDNNILKLGEDHVERVLYEIDKRNMTIDFNQGLDCIVFSKNENFAKIFDKYRRSINLLRFAWDSPAQDKFIDGTLDLLDKYNLRLRDRTSWYMLYGFKDSIEAFGERFTKILNRKGNSIKAMRYRDIETGQYGEYWNGFEIEVARAINGVTITGMLADSQAYFFGKNSAEFVKHVKAINMFKKHFNRNVTKADYPSIVKLMEKL